MENNSSSKWTGIFFAILLPITTALLIVFLEKKSSTNQTSNYIMTTIPPIRVSTTQPPKTNTFTTQPPKTNTDTTTSNTVVTQPPPQGPIVIGIASQYKVEGEGSAEGLFYTSWCGNVPNKICYGEYRLRFSNGLISPVTIKTDAGLNQGLTDPTLRFRLSNIPSNGVTAILQVKNVATNSNDTNWYDVNVPPQFIKPPQVELIFANNTGQIKKIEKRDNRNCVSSRIPNPDSTTNEHKYLGKFDSYEDCVEKAEIPSNARAVTWHKPIDSPWDNRCFSINDNNTNVVDNNTTCGIITN
jgi:hypothetical protein